ncbi:hypothetical protein ACXIUS_28265 [Bosea thiooxidans]
MTVDQFALNDLPYHLDAVIFIVIVATVGLGLAFALKTISEAIERTDQHAARNAAIVTASPDRPTASLADGGRH